MNKFFYYFLFIVSFYPLCFSGNDKTNEEKYMEVFIKKYCTSVKKYTDWKSSEYINERCYPHFMEQAVLETKVMDMDRIKPEVLMQKGAYGTYKMEIKYESFDNVMTFAKSLDKNLGKKLSLAILVMHQVDHEKNKDAIKNYMSTLANHVGHVASRTRTLRTIFRKKFYDKDGQGQLKELDQYMERHLDDTTKKTMNASLDNYFGAVDKESKPDKRLFPKKHDCFEVNLN